jgi:hypothetical protein
MIKVKILTSIAQLFFVLVLHSDPSFSMCDKNIREHFKIYSFNEKILTNEVPSDFSHQHSIIRDEIYISENKFYNKLYTPKVRYKFAHGPSIEYGLSVKRHALRLKFQIKT